MPRTSTRPRRPRRIPRPRRHRAPREPWICTLARRAFLQAIENLRRAEAWQRSDEARHHPIEDRARELQAARWQLARARDELRRRGGAPWLPLEAPPW